MPVLALGKWGVFCCVPALRPDWYNRLSINSAPWYIAVNSAPTFDASSSATTRNARSYGRGHFRGLQPERQSSGFWELGQLHQAVEYIQQSVAKHPARPH